MCYSIKQNVFIVFMEYKKRSLIIRMSNVLFDSIRPTFLEFQSDTIRFEAFDNSTRFRTLIFTSDRRSLKVFSIKE